MLLRNLSPPSMCNGTRLLIKALLDNVIVATIITGPAAKQLAHIPRILIIPKDLPVSLKRLVSCEDIVGLFQDDVQVTCSSM